MSFRDDLRAAIAEEEARPASFVLPNNWTPYPYQRAAWDYMVRGGKRCCLIWHRRAGKDSFALNWAAVASQERVGDYWHMFPEQTQARRGCWDAVNPFTGERLIDQAFPPAMRASTRDADMFIRFKNGSTWRLVGSDNHSSLVGATPCGVVYSEWSRADDKAEAFIRPILVANQGWQIFITTPFGNNHAKRTFDMAKADPQRWFCELLTVEQTGLLPGEELEATLREYRVMYGPDHGLNLYNQEYMCSWVGAFVGSFYGGNMHRMLLEGRIGNVQHDPRCLVHTAWDLGYSDASGIWFIQHVGREFRILDYYQSSGVGLDHYVGVLQEKARQYRWNYGNHYFPHDIAQHELSFGRSRVANLRTMGVKPTIVQRSEILEGINRVRTILDQARIDETRCQKGLDALRQYQSEWSEKNKEYAAKPKHDWTSHAADALRTFACGYREHVEKISSPVSRHGPGYGTGYYGPGRQYINADRGGNSGINPGCGWMRRGGGGWT
jgi:phage terminase large subunit